MPILAGMGTLCKYCYAGKYCANAAISGRECVGEVNCLVRSTADGLLRKRNDCSKEQWYGLYCAKYQRFYCAGRENCHTAESYMMHFAQFAESRGRN